MLQQSGQRLTFAVLFSFALHTFFLFGITFVVPDSKNIPALSQPLEVVLVNSKSGRRPNNATAYAQNNLDGGGNTEDERHAKTPFPVLGDAQHFTPEQTAQRLRQMQQESQRLLTRNKSDFSVAQNKTQQQNQDSSNADGHDLVQRSLEIVRLEAQISKNLDMYEKMPKRKFIGARTQEYRYAQYVEDWRAKVERIGNLNYPEIARTQKIYGKSHPHRLHPRQRQRGKHRDQPLLRPAHPRRIRHPHRQARRPLPAFPAGHPQRHRHPQHHPHLDLHQQRQAGKRVAARAASGAPRVGCERPRVAAVAESSESRVTLLSLRRQVQATTRGAPHSGDGSVRESSPPPNPLNQE